MNAADVAEGMAQAGCSAEEIAATLRALKDKPSSNAARQKRYRERLALRNVTSRYVTTPSPSPAKEPLPPTPPYQENKPLPPTPLTVADATVVDEPVDVCLFNDLATKKNKESTEALRSFGEQWNQLAAAFKFPLIDEIKTGSQRERHALARLREMPADGVQGLMTRIRGSPYLRGEVNGFRCTFDWIINASNFQKIMEGNYEVRKVAAFGRHGQAARVL